MAWLLLSNVAWGLPLLAINPDGTLPEMHQEKLSTSQVHILFVDDERPVRQTLTLYFGVKGVKVTAVSTGAEAMQLADHTQFSAAIFDLYLPQENGLQLLERFKQRHPATPVIMFTGHADDREKMSTAIAKGASAFFSKGESLSFLLDGVIGLIQKS